MEFNSGVYKCGMFSVLVPSVFMIFLFKLIYITFWAYVLNLLCKDKNRMLAWTLVLFPFLLLFVILGLFLITGKKAEKQLNIQDSSEGFGVVDMQKEEWTSLLMVQNLLVLLVHNHQHKVTMY